ncbi:2Fe-2S iron-sulfur cluster-binding protein [Aliiglaciecola sp. 2_MG-2023]|uniref:2Fe-2S iron-sulfur cluster-binding protein n=1 Tax=unclassified Aliiglaciecola TaxID=2593648 RepID=UPI0026E3DB6C|nr:MULTISPECIES: 2Fe-2S iron-sulfur cluster-binding protein [unclassified Aliiglaciecola]MDO6710730.1 2Fe-2S iron-sulfur cluster-binding protein [Aliiglaciecola sp. 2_MG-2023]MDO6751862.1 2Fe-2S iron-sulfur cluster-binding protein [Aliiglaciecola sp. 1_MG-2023]
MKISTINGTSFQQNSGETILDASINAGYPINHSCRSGRCGFCKVQLLSGETSAYRAEQLLQQDRDDNWILSCCHTALTDIEIDAGNLTQVIIPKVCSIPCAIDAIELLSPTMLMVTLQLPLIVKFMYLAGQYVDVFTSEGLSSSYWLSKASVEQQKIELHIAHNELDPMHQYWFHQAKVKDLLKLEGPKGTHFLRDTAHRDLFFLAFGAGIAAIKAMLEAHANLAKDKQAASITVIWQGQQPEDFYFDVAQMDSDIRFIRTLSSACPAWSGQLGEAQDVMLGMQPQMHNADVYATGPAFKLEHAQKVLSQHALNPRRFFSQATCE